MNFATAASFPLTGGTTLEYLMLAPRPRPMPAAKPATAAEIPTVLSPSSLNTFCHDCQVKWFYRKVLGLPETRGAALGLGTAIHTAILENFRQKIDTHEDLPTEGVVALFRNAWARELDQITLTEDDDPADLREAGDVMTRVYMDQAAPKIEPAAVEKPVTGTVGDVTVHGYIDILDVNGRVIDLKTAKKKPSGASVTHRVQIATYSMLEPQANGCARLDTLTKTKTVGLHQKTVEVSEADRKQATLLYSIAREAMQSGIYLPNRNSLLCSRTYCSYWERCCDEYGGEVA